LNDKQSPIRPNGIRVIATVCFALAAYLAINGVLVATAIVSFASGRYLLGEYASMGPVIYFVVAIVLAILGVGLLRAWSFARRLAIVAAALFFATSVLPISSAVAYFHVGALFIHGLKIILAVIAIRYLLQTEIVDFFSAKSAR
jgi:hypothetical protein